MIFVTYGELEIQSQVLSPSDKSILQVDYIFISNSLQEFANDPRILISLSTDHSPVHLSLFKEHKHTKGNGFWKFNSSLIKDHI